MEENKCKTCAYSKINEGICGDEEKEEGCKGEDYRKYEEEELPKVIQAKEEKEEKVIGKVITGEEPMGEQNGNKYEN